MRRPKPQNDVYAALGPVRSWCFGLVFIVGFGLIASATYWSFTLTSSSLSPEKRLLGRIMLLMWLVIIGDFTLGFILRVGFNHPWRLLGPLLCRFNAFTNRLNKPLPHDPSADVPPETRDP